MHRGKYFMRLSINENNAYNYSEAIDIKDLVGLSKQQIEKVLDNADIGTSIVNVRSKRKNWSKYDTVIHKEQAYKSNYYTPIGSPNDFKELDSFWSVAGYEDPYIVNTIYEITRNINKYYIIYDEENFE